MKGDRLPYLEKNLAPNQGIVVILQPLVVIYGRGYKWFTERCHSHSSEGAEVVRSKVTSEGSHRSCLIASGQTHSCF